MLVTDLNHDGHPDIIAGNLGLNSQCRTSVQEPAEMYYKDFDNNGSVEPPVVAGAYSCVGSATTGAPGTPIFNHFARNPH